MQSYLDLIIKTSYFECKAAVAFAGPRPKVSEDAFDDLLGGHSFSGKKEPKTMKELRKDMDVRDMDPDQRKVESVKCQLKFITVH